MNHVRKLLSTLGGIFLAALLIAALAPKAARGVAAALVQIVPGTITHVGQHESQLVSLVCESPNHFCNSKDSSTNVASAAYQVPAGSTLVITDYEFRAFDPNLLVAGQSACDSILNANVDLTDIRDFLRTESCAVIGPQGFVYGKEHFTTGILVGSGVTIADRLAEFGIGTAAVQGYLVPND
jgi:hypothetical protein